jgi:hypothetical protein
MVVDREGEAVKSGLARSTLRVVGSPLKLHKDRGLTAGVPGVVPRSNVIDAPRDDICLTAIAVLDVERAGTA